jgi:hypothetical protein
MHTELVPNIIGQLTASEFHPHTHALKCALKRSVFSFLIL